MIYKRSFELKNDYQMFIVRFNLRKKVKSIHKNIPIVVVQRVRIVKY